MTREKVRLPINESAHSPVHPGPQNSLSADSQRRLHLQTPSLWEAFVSVTQPKNNLNPKWLQARMCGDNSYAPGIPEKRKLVEQASLLIEEWIVEQASSTWSWQGGRTRIGGWMDKRIDRSKSKKHCPWVQGWAWCVCMAGPAGTEGAQVWHLSFKIWKLLGGVFRAGRRHFNFFTYFFTPTQLSCCRSFLITSLII